MIVATDNSTKSIGEELADERVPIRQLPRQSRPLTNETVTSYLSRLGYENGLPHDLLPSLITTRNTSALRVTAALTGRPPRSLIAALPELRLGTPKLLTHLATLPGFDGTAAACQLCAASRSSRVCAIVWSNGQDSVCLHHQRWVGGAVLRSAGQISLRHAPEVLTANLQHRHLVHQHGQQTTSEAFAEAFVLADDLYQRDQLPGIEQLILRLSGQSPIQTSSIDPQVLAAQYPAAVGLASLLIQPGWTTRVTASAETWRKAAPQIAAALRVPSRLTDVTYIRLARWNFNPRVLR